MIINDIDNNNNNYNSNNNDDSKNFSNITTKMILTIKCYSL